MNGSNDEVLLTPRELANRLQISIKWVEKQTQNRRIPGQVKVGRVWRYSWVEIQRRMLSGQILLESLDEKSHH
jgi:hypothetical protein